MTCLTTLWFGFSWNTSSKDHTCIHLLKYIFQTKEISSLSTWSDEHIKNLVNFFLTLSIVKVCNHRFYPGFLVGSSLFSEFLSPDTGKCCHHQHWGKGGVHPRPNCGGKYQQSIRVTANQSSCNVRSEVIGALIYLIKQQIEVKLLDIIACP